MVHQYEKIQVLYDYAMNDIQYEKIEREKKNLKLNKLARENCKSKELKQKNKFNLKGK